MNKAINVNDLPEFDIEQHLKTDADVAEYLHQVLEEGDSSELAAALGHIARARGTNRTPFVFDDQDDAPELTKSFFDQADLYVGKTLKARGLPKSAVTKELVKIRLDADVLDAGTQPDHS